MTSTRAAAPVLSHSEPPTCSIWQRLAAEADPSVEWLQVSVPVATGNAQRLWQKAEAWAGVKPSMFWAEPGSRAVCVALGTAIALEAAGNQRVAQLLHDAAQLWSKLAVLTLPGSRAASPKIFGGLSFAPGMRSDEPWLDFPESSFVLPRWLYTEERGRATLTRTLHVTELAAEGSSPFRELLELQALLRGTVQGTVTPAPPSAKAVAMPAHGEDAWLQLVRDAKVELQAGILEKIVLAQRTTLTLSAPVDTAWLLGRLAAEAPASSIFAIQRGDATFIGATPEWLIRQNGLHIESEALAGSCSIDDGPESLLASVKDRAEHALVVRALSDTLRELSHGVSHPPSPAVLRLRHLLHLRTPVRATLKEHRHVLDLVSQLHPTPAVGGVPRERALAAIRAMESSERGWFAAPLGWFDSAGNGRFVIGLRSGLVRGRCIDVYAGAGIMPDSEPSLELAEVYLKQRTFLRALGVVR